MEQPARARSIAALVDYSSFPVRTLSVLYVWYPVSMFDMEEFFGMGFEEEPELSNDLVQGGCEPEGGGWGSFLLGGAVGALVASNLPSGKLDFPDQCLIPEGFSKDERIFLTQLWRFEQELDSALGENNYERVFLLLNGLVFCINGPWKKFIPENLEYAPSLKLELEMSELVSPILERAQRILEDNVIEKINPERLRELDNANVVFNPNDWHFTEQND